MAAIRPVLVIEDDEGFREALRRWLELLGYVGVLVDSIEAAALEFPKQTFHAVLLDLHLPGRSGHVFLRQLRGIGSNTPAIVMSGGAQIDDVILALRQGAADFLRKPFRIDQLSTALERVGKLQAAATGEAPMAAPDPSFGVALSAPPASLRSGSKAAARPTLSTLLDHIRTGKATLPVLDAQVGRIAKLLAAPEVDSEELQSLVESDANLSATLLRTANSAYYSRGNPVKTIRDAFMRLGSRSVLNVVTGAALQARLSARGPFAEIARRQWINNLATSRFCGELAKALRRSDVERLQLFGLIHNLGEMLFIHLASGFDLAEEVSAIVAEMGVIHEEAGLALAKSWKMSSEICRIVGAHHWSDGSGDYDFEHERFIVLAGWNMAIKCGFSYLPDQVGEPGEALAELGLTEGALSALCADAEQWSFD